MTEKIKIEGVCW